MRQPARIPLRNAIPEGDDEGPEDRQVPLQTQGAMSDAFKRQRSPGGSFFQEHRNEFDDGGWETVDFHTAQTQCTL